MDQLSSIDRTFNELTERLGDPDVLSNRKLIMDVSKERASVEEVILLLFLLRLFDNMSIFLIAVSY